MDLSPAMAGGSSDQGTPAGRRADDAAARGSFSVTIVNTGDSFDCPVDQPLLKAMAALGRRGIPSGCHGGGCGICRIEIVAGRYTTLSMSRAHVSREDERRGIALACRVMPQSDMRVRALGKMKQCVAGRRYGLV